MSRLKRGLVKIETRGKEKTVHLLSFIKKDFFVLGLTIFLASSIIVTKGTSPDNQTSIFQGLFKKYIEEVSVFTNKAQSAGINSSGVFVGLENQINHPDSISTLQQTALLAFNSLENDLSTMAGGKNSQIAKYTVQEGDTVSFIASDFGVSINTIIWANHLKNIDSISPGDELTIPPVSGVIHTVKSGETVSSIAKKYRAKEDEITAFNKLPLDGSIRVGNELIVPDGQMTGQKIASSNVKTAAIKRFAYLPDLGDFFMTPANGRNWGYIHGRNGVDIAASCGTPILAAANGVAAIADAVGWNGGFGKYIKLVHANGTETVYAHNSKILVNQGTPIERGQQIALMGTTGRSTGCHLHFEVHGARNPLIKY